MYTNEVRKVVNNEIEVCEEKSLEDNWRKDYAYFRFFPKFSRTYIGLLLNMRSGISVVRLLTSSFLPRFRIGWWAYKCDIRNYVVTWSCQPRRLSGVLVLH